MANEYADWEELKEMRNITSSDHDARLKRAVTRASRAIDKRCSRIFWRTGVASERRLSPRGRTIISGGEELLLTDDIATEGGLAITLAGASVSVDGLSFSYFGSNSSGAITGITRTSWYGGAIAITAEWGWPEVPDGIEEATLLLANRRYMRKDSPEGVSGWSQEGPIQVSRFDPDIEDLVNPYVIEGFGS